MRRVLVPRENARDVDAALAGLDIVPGRQRRAGFGRLAEQRAADGDDKLP